MAAGDLSMPIDCACKKFTVRTARRSYIGAALGGRFETFSRRIYFLSYRRKSPAGTYANVFFAQSPGDDPVPEEDYTIRWSTECANYGQSEMVGEWNHQSGRGSAGNVGSLPEDMHRLVEQMNQTGRYVFSKPVLDPPPSAIDPQPEFILESFTPDESNSVRIVEPCYVWFRNTPSSFIRVFGGYFEHELSLEFSEAVMETVLERDLGNPIACAYSPAWIVNTIHDAPAMEVNPALVGQTTIGGVSQKDDSYQFLPPVGVLHSQAEQDPEVGANDGQSGHAGRFITAAQSLSDFTRLRPPENWLAKAFIYWPGRHSLQEHEFGFAYNFGIGTFGDPPDTPDQLPMARSCEDIEIACPRSITGYEVEPPETNGRIFWLENYGCPGE